MSETTRTSAKNEIDESAADEDYTNPNQSSWASQFNS